MLSALDDRYFEEVKELQDFFGEKAYFKYRAYFEIKYLFFLFHKLQSFMKKNNEEEDNGEEYEYNEKYHLTASEKKYMLSFCKKILTESSFSDEFFYECKCEEKESKHDVKAIEIVLRKMFADILGSKISFIHFGLTSEDVNNVAYSLMLRDATYHIIFPEMCNLLKNINDLAMDGKDLIMLSRTHGQVAVPTTLGKEISVFSYRLLERMKVIQNTRFSGKIGGAVGNLNAHNFVFPKVSWRYLINNSFLTLFNLDPEEITTQVSGEGRLSEILLNYKMFNDILIDFCRDMWLYASLDYLKIKSVGVGSSTMPHKSNPIEFENAEGNLELANNLFCFFADKLSKSRLQRDLSGNTVKRNIGLAFGYSLLAYKNIISGIKRLSVDSLFMNNDVQRHPEVLTEAVQQKAREDGVILSYEKVMNMVGTEEYRNMVCYSNYIGDAKEITERTNQSVLSFLEFNRYLRNQKKGAGAEND